MTTDYQADHGRKLFATGVSLFGSGLIWFRSSWPGGVFTLHPLNLFDAAFRAEIMLGAILAAYGLLAWRGAAHDLSLPNYVSVASCALALVLCASEVACHQRRDSLLVNMEVGAVQLMMVICIAVFGGWWADSAYMHERFREHFRSSRFVK